MSKIIKYNDYVQINPDQRILSLDKSEKIQLIDNMLERSYNGGKGLVITYDLSHSGRRINNRIYSTKGQQRGIDSLTNPYPKPILKNHDQSGEPIGRFIGGEWQNLYDEAKEFLQSSQAALDIHSAFAGDDPEKIYNSLKAMNLIDNKQWPGLGRMRVQANITDEEAIKKFMDGRYLTFSAGSTTNRHVCSICLTDWAEDGMCEHRHGKKYDGETCVFITGDFLVMEGSVVNTPADDLSQLVHMEMMDSLDSEEKITDKDIYIDEFILTDSIYNIGEENETQRIQAAQEIDAYKKEEKEGSKEEKVEKKYDHEMSISESAMMELHQKGETYITQRGDNQIMIIKVKYSGKMKKDNLEDEFASFEEEVNELVEELIDEKTFKVPTGARGNAQKVLNWKKEKGSEVKGMTPVGWARARQLATKSEIGLSTVKRMAAFNRHRKNAAVDPKYKSEPWKDRGYVAWLGWGGTSGIDWAVKISAANDSLYNGITEDEKELFTTPLNEMIGDFDLDAYKSSPKGKGAKTPAKPSERIKGSKKNKEGSAKKANSKIEVGSVLNSLKEKVSSHNKKYGKEKGKRVTLGMLKAVYRRGAGAFSSTHRPGMSRSGWGVARVNAFLKLVRSGRPSNPKYKQDNDLLPAGHPRKSSTKPTKQKDFTMVEKETTEELDLNSDLEIDSDKDADLEIEAVEPTEEQQATHDESLSEDEEETLDAEDSVEIDWELLDLAMQGILIQEDAQLSTEARNKLPDSAFCGPERSFPIPDCAHVTAAKRLIGRYKGSDATKAKIMACVNKKASSMSCEKSEDYMQLRKDFEELQNQYSDLEDKFKTVLESLVVKSKKKDAEIVEIETNDDLIEDSTAILDKKVENPSEHIQDEKVSSKKEVKLPSFEQKIVDEYKRIKSEDGDFAASLYLNNKSFYLPKGFDPNKF